MDDLIGRLVAHAGVDRTASAAAAGVIAQFLLNEGPPAKVRALIRHMPDAAAAMPASSASLRSPRKGQTQAVTSGILTFHAGRQGRTQSAKSSTRSRASAGSSDAC